MEVESLRRARRALSAAVALAGIAVVMARLGAPPGVSGPNVPGTVASLGLVVTLVALAVVWRKELAANAAAFAARDLQQLLSMTLMLETAQKKTGAARQKDPEVH